MCSTPFGIIVILTLEQTEETFYIIVCSTPFGIIGILTTVDNADRFLADLCSTPFGIIGILTLSTPCCARFHIRCAQRLSASSEFSLDGDYDPVGQIWCSTPFG